MSRLCSTGSESEEPRGRVLRLLDVVGLGLGGPFGLGIFVLIGFVAHSVAGPAVALCVLVAAILALLAGQYLQILFQTFKLKVVCNFLAYNFLIKFEIYQELIEVAFPVAT